MHTCTHSRVGVLAAVDKTHDAGDQRGASLCVCAPAVDPGRERGRAAFIALVIRLNSRGGCIAACGVIAGRWGDGDRCYVETLN